jgi:ParB family chromosome partitioning protein
MSSPDAKRRNLGRGLDALLGASESGPTPARTAPVEASHEPGNDIASIPIGEIHPGRYQPRQKFDEDELDALAESVRAKGILQPILVRPHPDKTGEFELVAGERRWLAAQRAQLQDVPAIIRDLTDKDTLEIGLVENVQRQDLSPLEEAEGYKRLVDEFSHTQETLASIVGKSRSHVANTIRLLNLPDEVKTHLYERRLTAGHARALLTAADPAALARRIVKQGLSVREAEKLAGEGGDKPKRKRSAPAAQADKDTDTLALERELTDATGLKVTINHRGESGQMVISYGNLEQLDDLVSRLVRPLG